MKVALVINIPAPYRIPVFEKLAQKLGQDFLVIFAARAEPNRSWNIGELHFNHLFLNENIKEKKDGFNYVHNNFDVIKHLKVFKPDVVITTGFNPTHLYAWLYTKIFRKKHIYMTDGTIESEKHLSLLHKIMRKVVYSSSDAFIGAGQKTKELYKSYNISEEKVFQSHLSASNECFLNSIGFEERKFDLMFSGQFTERKLPFFFAEIAKEVSLCIPTLKVLILGDGPLKKEFLSQLDRDKIDYLYAGFVDQKELPSYYSSARLFLFTTRLDPCGVVANEALASGTPVIVTPHAGVANDLVQDKYNGYVITIDSTKWAHRALEVLQDKEKWKNLSTHATESVKRYTYDNAAAGIFDACEYSCSKSGVKGT